LGELLKQNVPGTAFGYIRDPEVVQQAIAAGVGSYISCKLGGKTDKLHGEPLNIEKAYVKCISDGTFIKESPMGAGALQNIGPVVRLEIVNVSVVVGTGRIQTMDAGPFACAGVDWRKMRILK
jgi:microcystin degradation protein MlrC